MNVVFTQSDVVKNLDLTDGWVRRDPSAEFILSVTEGPQDDIAMESSAREKVRMGVQQ
jgi:hypothetical protein